jgi:hypothetical protein
MVKGLAMKEVKEWNDFSLAGQLYDLSHLNAHTVDYLDDRDAENHCTYRFQITYSFHCFTEHSPSLTPEESKIWTYKSPRESRHFNLERYHLSKGLPDIIRALGSPGTMVFHAQRGNYSTIKVTNSFGVEVDYFIAFSVFKENRKLRMHVESAYPKENLGRQRKVNFWIIAHNLLNGRPLPKPPK